MPRTGFARRSRYATSLVSVLVACLLLGAISSTAVAADEPVAPAPTSPEAPEAPEAPRETSQSFATIAANDDAGTQRSYSVKYWNVLANDKCGNVTPCAKTRMTAPMQVTSVPPGWSAKLTSTGTIRVAVPGNIVAGIRTIGYSITDASGTANATLSVRVYLSPTPDRYNPTQGSKFSHAFQKGSSYKIRTHLERTINSAPAGSQIRILSWSFASKKLREALVAAKRRGVSVQIIMSIPADPSLSDYGKLKKLFGGERWKKDPVRGSWVYACNKSCRGVGGTMHAKVFMFSQAASTRWIVMSGSGNMTDYAAQMQWNQLYTTINKPLYDAMQGVFFQAKRDVAVSPRLVTLTYPTTTFWMTPLNGNTANNDFIYKALQNVTCTGADTRSGRTKIRIGMYVWRDDRGDWMARRIRQLWNQGCDIRIIYAIMGNRNKAILYNPAGRGRIPLRQTIQVDEDHRPVWYIHQKYIAIAGNISGKPKAFEVYQGSFNFSDLGMRSDENMQKIYGYANWQPYEADFNQVWKQRETRAPNPNSYVLQVERIGTRQAGRYQFMESP
ncbi:MAG: phospholipase D-like domain-containing protein [Propionibacteriales bacterium]|nr:phospholipase D-like domain-containing protein [Propionibacteriales bacterium]